MSRKRPSGVIIGALPLLAVSLLITDASAQSSSESVVKVALAEILPPAKSGECYAKVAIPASYSTESVDVVMKEASDSYRITPAVFEDTTRRVLVRDASTEIDVVQPVTEIEKDTFLVAQASSRWVRNSVTGAIPLSDGEVRDLRQAGINQDAIPVGSCMYEHYRPATIKSSPSKVLVSQATEKLDVTPAKFRRASESVLVMPTHKRLLEVPATYKETTEQVLVAAAYSEWRKGTGPIQRIDNTTGEIMCLIDVPAVYETVKKQVLDVSSQVTSVTEPAKYSTVRIEKLVSDAKEVRTPVQAVFKTMDREQIEIPGEFTWLAKGERSAENGDPTGRIVCHQAVEEKRLAYDRTVVKTPGKFIRTKVPEEYQDVEIASLASDAVSGKQTNPAVTQSFERRVKLQNARFDWMPVLCETNTTGDIVTRLQQALSKEGYKVGGIDGVLGRGTLAALERYQQKNNLAEGGVTIESMKSLGVEL